MITPVVESLNLDTLQGWVLCRILHLLLVHRGVPLHQYPHPYPTEDLVVVVYDGED